MDELTIENIKTYVKELRDFMQLSQVKFAEEVGVSVETIRKWEQGKGKPSPLAWEKLSKVVQKVKKQKESIK